MQDKCRLFKGLRKMLKSQYNETVLSLQYCKLTKEQNDNADEWMGCLRLKANECDYK